MVTMSVFLTAGLSSRSSSRVMWLARAMPPRVSPACTSTAFSTTAGLVRRAFKSSVVTREEMGISPSTTSALCTKEAL